MSKRILICGGGTAGHVYPAVAIIENIKSYCPNCKLLFAGTKSGMENEYITGLGVNFEEIKACGLSINYNLFKKVYNEFVKKQMTAGPRIDSYKLIVQFFTVYPEITDDVYDNGLLPGDIEMLADTIMAKHGYAQPIVEEL